MQIKSQSIEHKPEIPKRTDRKAGEESTEASKMRQAGQEAASASLERTARHLARMEGESARIMGDAASLTAPQKEESRRDSAELTEEAQPERREMNWDSRKEAEAWKRLLAWLPSEAEELGKQLRALKGDYLFFLRELIKSVPPESQMIYVEKLREVLMAKLEGLIKTALPQLRTFFSSYGMENSLPKLRQALYFSVTGSALPLNAARREWEAACERETSGFRGLRPGPASQKREAGRQGEPAEVKIYSRSGEAADYGTQTRENLAEKLIGYAQGKGAPQKESLPPQKLFSIGDLRGAERFVKAFGANGANLLTHSPFTAKSEAQYACVWILEKGKAELFFEKEQPGPAMKQELRLAVDRLIAAAIDKAANEARTNDGQRFERQQLYDVYRYAMRKYEGGQKVNKAIRDGLLYALRYFLQNEDNAYSAETERKAVFFQTQTEKYSLKQDLERGSLLLEEDWKDYLSQMGYQEEQLLLAAGLYSFWGMLIEPEKKQSSAKPNLTGALAIAAVFAAAAFIAVLFLVL